MKILFGGDGGDSNPPSVVVLLSLVQPFLYYRSEYVTQHGRNKHPYTRLKVSGSPPSFMVLITQTTRNLHTLVRRVYVKP